MILNINYNVSHYMGMSQMCAGAGDYFRPSKPHSEKLCLVMTRNQNNICVDRLQVTQ